MMNQNRRKRRRREALSVKDHRLLDAVQNNDADEVQQALRAGANVNAVRHRTTPLTQACYDGSDRIVGILLDAGADARWKDRDGRSAITEACDHGNLSTVQLLLNHDSGLLEFADGVGQTPLIVATRHDDRPARQYSDIVRFLLDQGADANRVSGFGDTALLTACCFGCHDSARLLMAAGADVNARGMDQHTALHLSAGRGDIEVVRELILQRNANMFAVDEDGCTPFYKACNSRRNAAVDPLLEMCGNRLTQDHGPLALHELLKVAEYSFAFAESVSFHPPRNPLRIILPLGELTVKHLRTLLHALDPELIHNRDDTGKLPIHIACQTNAPLEVLSLILELDPAVLRIADFAGSLPLHLLCGTTAATEYSCVRYLVEQGGVGTLAARNQQGASPLHVLCGSTNPPLRIVQYLMQSFPGSVAMRTNAGQYPFMMAAAAESSTAPLSVIYELVRVNPGLVVPRYV